MLGDINVIQPPTISRYSVTVKFNKIYVKDASEGFCGHYTGEFSIDLGVNGKYRKLNTMQVRSGHEYPLENIEEVVEVDENGEVDIYTNGVELDDESSAIWDVSIFGCSTEANDPLGNALKKYNKNNNWGQTSGQFIETNHYIIYYDISLRNI
ncbi:MAG: hypothetical protein HZT40_01240 [Candidatus Thiothrix singaporensis]|uniref:Uncharacterized protein n=1 Tax=Candidatus Thiothrix singaporensis TaxID=2799669 RepID=A0A7L6AMY3_9GAMM|nr:MAG: hypothetical protein HZT40_01240 [Candidatus Thiothrix singaporensis]